MSTTLKDIANGLGISIMTVSRALNNKPDVNEKTRNLVFETAEKLNYSPNIIARSLVKKQTNTIGILIPDIKNSFFAEVVSGIEIIASKNKYSIVLCVTHDDPNVEFDSIKMLIEKRVDGLLIIPSQKDYQYLEILKKFNIPFVFLVRRNNLLKNNYINVNNDHFYSAKIAVDYLIKKGYKKIYFLAKYSYTSVYKERVKGCEKAFNRNKKSLNEFHIIHLSDNIDSCYDAIQTRINYNGDRIGLYVWNDHTVLTVYKAMKDKGLKIPEDVGVVGNDDIEFAKHLSIPLTTVQNPGHEIGLKGAEIIVKSIKSEELLKIDNIVLKPKIIKRMSA